jgi:hypothetical protein
MSETHAANSDLQARQTLDQRQQSIRQLTAWLDSVALLLDRLGCPSVQQDACEFEILRTMLDRLRNRRFDATGLTAVEGLVASIDLLAVIQADPSQCPAVIDATRQSVRALRTAMGNTGHQLARSQAQRLRALPLASKTVTGSDIPLFDEVMALTRCQIDRLSGPVPLPLPQRNLPKVA